MFLSALAEHEDIVKGLDGGAEERIDSLLEQKPQAPASPISDDRNRLLEAGLDKWRQRDFRGALELLLQARAHNPDDGVLRANIEIVRRKLEADPHEP